MAISLCVLCAFARDAGTQAAIRVLYQRILASISGLNPGPLMDADGPLMEQPTVLVVDLAPGWAKRLCRATHDSVHFKNQQSSLDNHQSNPRDARGRPPHPPRPLLPQPKPWGRGQAVKCEV